jgi:hypothetical protein
VPNAWPAHRPAANWQVRFDDGHQQRYLPDRAAALEYVLAVGPRAASPRFELFADDGQVVLADGSLGGRRFVLAQVIDLARPGEAQRLRAELAELAGSDEAVQPEGHR